MITLKNISRTLAIALLVLIFLNPSDLCAQKKRFNPDSLLQRDLKFVPVPIVYRKPETGFAFGLAGVYYYYAQKNKDQKPSFLKLQAIYTQKKQFLTGFDWELFLNQNKYWINIELDNNRFLNEFYGLGNSTSLEQRERYEYRLTQVFLKPRIQLRPNFYLGALLDYSNIRNLNSLDSIELHLGLLNGSRGSSNAGIGLNFLYDSRDNRFTAERGLMLDFKVMNYARLLGGENHFFLSQLDCRAFKQIFPRWIFAYQLNYRNVQGNVPFNYLSQIGGDQMMRGYFMGRYSDKFLMANQAEIRFQVHRFFGLTAFYAAGKVGDNLGDFANGQLHYTRGGGFRVPLSLKERINGRFDIGFNDEGGYAWYLSITEAF